MKKIDKDKERLKQEDYQIVASIILGWSLVYRLITKMTPEQYANKVFLKGTRSKRKLATVRLMFDTIREESDQLVTPKEFNEKLAKQMLDKSVNDLSVCAGCDTLFHCRSDRNSNHAKSICCPWLWSWL